MPRSSFQYLIVSRADAASMTDALSCFAPVSTGAEATIYRFPGEVPQSLLSRISSSGWAETRLMDCAHFILQRNTLIQQALYNDFFDYIGSEYESLIDVSRNCENIEYLLEHLSQQIGDLKGATLMDFGCGTGLAVPQLQAAGAKFVGVDQSHHMRFIAQHRGMTAVNMASLLAQPNQFDGAIASYVLHLVSDEIAIAGVVSVLKRGATLVGNFHKSCNIQWMDDTFARHGCSAIHLRELHTSAVHGVYVGYTKL